MTPSKWTRRAAACAAFAGLFATSAQATPTFTWTWDQSPVHAGPTDTLTFSGTLVNTGTTRITAINWLWIDNFGSIGPSVAAWNWTPDFWTINSGLDIDAGESHSFSVIWMTLGNAAPGTYTAFSGRQEIGVVDTTGTFSGQIQVSNTATINVPEPAALSLVAVALLGLGLARRSAVARKV